MVISVFIIFFSSMILIEARYKPNIQLFEIIDTKDRGVEVRPIETVFQSKKIQPNIAKTKSKRDREHLLYQLLYNKLKPIEPYHNVGPTIIDLHMDSSEPGFVDKTRSTNVEHSSDVEDLLKFLRVLNNDDSYTERNLLRIDFDRTAAPIHRHNYGSDK